MNIEIVMEVIGRIGSIVVSGASTQEGNRSSCFQAELGGDKTPPSFLNFSQID